MISFNLVRDIIFIISSLFNIIPGFNYTFILIAAGILAFAYLIIINPFINKLKSVTNHTELNLFISNVTECKKFDERSYDKFIAHLKLFMLNYSNSKDVDKLNHNKNKLMHYLRRIPLRIHNDANLEYKLRYSIDSINTILENYVNEARTRTNQFYFPSYD